MESKGKQDVISIGGRDVHAETKEIDISRLRYYPDNPRINYILSKLGKDLDQEKIEEALWKLDSTKLLAEDIRKNGGLIDEIWAMGDYVIEGNRRLCAYRHIYRDSSAEERPKWQKIRTKILSERLNPKELFSFLGKLHIQGKQPWDPYEKASYIYRTINENQMLIQEVSEIVGMDPSAIKIQIKAYELMKNKFLPSLTELADEKTELKKFSIFEEYFKSADLQEMAQKNPEILDSEKFVSWVREGRIRSAAYDVKKDLYAILKSKPARKVFLASPPEDAIAAAKETAHIDRPESADSFLKQIKKITNVLRNTQIMKLQEKIKENPRVGSIIRKFHSEVQRFYHNLGLENPNKNYFKKL